MSDFLQTNRFTHTHTSVYMNAHLALSDTRILASVVIFALNFALHNKKIIRCFDATQLIILSPSSCQMEPDKP